MNFIRMAVRGKEDFDPESFRTHVLDGHRRVAGKLKTTGEWQTQAFLVRRDAPIGKIKYWLSKANELIARYKTGKRLSAKKLEDLM